MIVCHDCFCLTSMAWQLARITAWRVLVVSCSTMLCVCFTEILLRRQLGGIFTADPIILDAISTVLPMATLMQFFDGVQTVLSGSMRACALQTHAAVGNLFGYYAVCLPLAYYFAFYSDWGLTAVWLGLFCGVLTTSFIFCAILSRVDWVKVCMLHPQA
jgi:MATE family multidrug resistance protein